MHHWCGCENSLSLWHWRRSYRPSRNCQSPYMISGGDWKPNSPLFLTVFYMIGVFYITDYDSISKNESRIWQYDQLLVGYMAVNRCFNNFLYSFIRRKSEVNQATVIYMQPVDFTKYRTIYLEAPIWVLVKYFDAQDGRIWAITSKEINRYSKNL